MAAPTMLMIPFPSPEEKYPQRIVIADITKEMEIILSAGMPSSSISELAENNCSNCPGKHQNITVPHRMVEQYLEKNANTIVINFISNFRLSA